MKLENKVILVVSNEAWGETWYSKHNYAYELSKKNTVYFVDAVGRWHPRNLLTNKVEVTTYKGNLHILRYRNFFPALNMMLFRLNNRLVSGMLRRYLKARHKEQIILWSFDPHRLYAPTELGADLSIFHCADNYFFKPYGEKLLAANVDHIFCISREFLDIYKSFNDSIHALPHGISSEEFSVSREELENENIQLRDYGLYIGTIDERLNFPFIERMVKELPHMSFLFIGRLTEPALDPAGRRLFIEKKYPNVHAPGAKHFKKLKPYIASSLFCLAPMNRLHPGNTISHHKTFQYLAFGKPVFCTTFSEYIPISHLLYMTSDEDELMDMLHKFIEQGEDPALREQRIAHARKHTYEENFRRAEEIITGSN